MSVATPGRVRAQDLQAACAWLRAGGIVVYPTDTFYGLAVDPTSELAVNALFDLKGRDSNVAVPLIAASIAQVDAVTSGLDGASRRLAEFLWPGPISLVLEAGPAIVEAVHAGRGTVAVRVPADDVARAFAEAFGGVITSTSANRSGEPAISRVADLGPLAGDPRVFVLDGGPTPGGVPSTIVDARCSPPVCIRPGAMAWDAILATLSGA